MNPARRIVAVLLVASAVLAGGRAAHGQDYCTDFTANYDFSGWQTPGAGTGSGTWGCAAGNNAIVFYANANAYTEALRKTPEAANLEVRLHDLVVWGMDGSADDAFSVLLHWRDPVHPSGCCEPIHGSSGLRVLFSTARGTTEIYEEVEGQSVGPVATIPFALPVNSLQEIAIAYRGPFLSLYRDYGYLVATVEVPMTPPGRVGYDLRRARAKLVPSLTLDCTSPGDYDCDGVPDAQDNCPQNGNSDQVDLDGDGAGDACDLDDDGDGVPDLQDLCPRVADPGQADADGDGQGDACDPCPADASNDVDSDGVCGAVDNCPTTANPDQSDVDGDGQGDLCDTNDGLLILRWADAAHLQWQYDTQYVMYDIYRGDLDVLRTTGVYVEDPLTGGPLDLRSCNLRYTLFLDSLQPPLGKAAFYHVTGARDGLEGGLGADSAGNPRPNDHGCFADCDQPFTTIVDTSSGPATAQYRVIDNLADWCVFRPSSCGAGLIDFATEVAIVAALGTRNSSCDAVAIACMRHGGAAGSLDVVTQEWFPGASCACFAVLAQPMVVAKVPRPAGTVVFHNQSQALVCP